MAQDDGDSIIHSVFIKGYGAATEPQKWKMHPPTTVRRWRGCYTIIIIPHSAKFTTIFHLLLLLLDTLFRKWVLKHTLF